MNGRKREDSFRHSMSGGLRLVGGDDCNRPYRSFLAELADLRRVAQMISQSISNSLYIDVQASVYEGEENHKVTDSALSTLQDMIAEDELDQTRLVILKGDAGAGKTQILKELAKRQADRYLRGEATKLLLYVNAQGRSLARLDEALAVALQDLRAGITYHAVPPLTRHDLLVPIIDGFDELLGVSGYEDAFSSLGSFLERLHGEGQLLASARSIYYEEEFLDRADRLAKGSDQAWSHLPVEVHDWSESNQLEYLKALTEASRLTPQRAQRLAARVNEVFEANPGFSGKPLFYTRTLDLLLHQPDQQFQSDLLTDLVNGFLERERKEKLLDQREEPVLDQSQLRALFSEVALEMWTVQTRELSPDGIRDVAKLILEEMELSAEMRQVVVERAPTLAFLARTEGAGIAFEHESFFFDFLAQAIAAGHFDTGTNLRMMLGTSALPEDVADRTSLHLARAAALDTQSDLTSRIDELCAASQAQWVRADQVRENAGLLAMKFLTRFASESDTPISGLQFRTLTFPGGNLDGVVLRESGFSDVAFRRTDLRRTRIENCQARNLTLKETKISETSTRLELAGLNPDRDIAGIWSAERNGLVYSPAQILKILAECGAPIPERPAPQAQPPEEICELIERLMRAYRRANPICTADNNLRNLFRHPRWSELHAALIKHGVVTEETRGTGGRSKQFLRRQFLPEQIMAGLMGASTLTRILLSSGASWSSVNKCQWSASVMRPASTIRRLTLLWPTDCLLYSRLPFDQRWAFGNLFREIWRHVL